MGTLLGRASRNKFMVDLDVYKEGGEAATNWYLGLLAIHNNRQELETWEQITGGGGRQLFFECPPNWTPPKSSPQTSLWTSRATVASPCCRRPCTHIRQAVQVARRALSRRHRDTDSPAMVCEEIDRLGRASMAGLRRWVRKEVMVMLRSSLWVGPIVSWGRFVTLARTNLHGSSLASLSIGSGNAQSNLRLQSSKPRQKKNTLSGRAS